MSDSPRHLFRQEALEHHGKGEIKADAQYPVMLVSKREVHP